MKKFLLLIFISIFFLSSAPPLFSQTGIDRPEIWRFIEETEIKKSVVKITCRKKSESNPKGDLLGFGSGSVISKEENQEGCPEGWYYGRILTAAHVADCDLMDINFHNGKKSENAVKIKLYDEMYELSGHKNDAALVRACIPNDIQPLKIAKDLPNLYGDCQILGFGGGSDKVRHFGSKIAICDDKGTCILGFAMQGDSGGPILNDKGEIISVVSSITYSNRHERVNGALIGAPTNGPSLKIIKELTGL
jgi:hypothetical protein